MNHRRLWIGPKGMVLHLYHSGFPKDWSNSFQCFLYIDVQPLEVRSFIVHMLLCFLTPYNNPGNSAAQIGNFCPDGHSIHYNQCFKGVVWCTRFPIYLNLVSPIN